MPYSKVNAATSALDTLARTVAVPRDHKPTRMPTFPALERTAVLSFTDTLTHPVASGNPGYALVIRDPAVPLWLHRAPHSAAYGAYMVIPRTTSAAVGQQEYTCPPVGSSRILFGAAGGLVPTVLSGCSTFPLLVCDANTFFPNFSGYWGVQAEYVADPGGSSIRFAGEYIWGNQDVTGFASQQAIPMAGTAGTFRATFVAPVPAGVLGIRLTFLQINTANSVVTSTAYFGITSDQTQAPGGIVGAPFTSPVGTPNPAMVPASAPPEASTVVTPWQSVRATAAGVLFSNVTAVLNKEGTINAARVASDAVSLFDVRDWVTAIAKVHPSDRYFGPLEKGLYTFTLPDGASETFREVLGFEANGVYNAGITLFDLNAFKYAHIIIFNDLDATAGSTMAITLDRHIEFRTTSVLFPTAYTTVQLEMYHAAQMALVRQGVFYENPVHLSTIAGLISSAVRTLAPIVAPYAMSAAKHVGAQVVSYAGKKFAQMTQSAPGAQPARGQKPKPKIQKKKPVRVKR